MTMLQILQCDIIVFYSDKTKHSETGRCENCGCTRNGRIASGRINCFICLISLLVRSDVDAK